MKVNIEHIERYLLYGITGSVPESQHPVKHTLKMSLICSAVTVVAFVFAYRQLPYLENINIYHFYWILVLIPVVAILTILICKYIFIPKGNYSERKEYNHKKLIKKFSGFAIIFVFLPLFWFFQTAAQVSIAMVSLVGFVMGGVFFEFGACLGLYNVYLMYRYAPYFKDERLRGPTK